MVLTLVAGACAPSQAPVRLAGNEEAARQALELMLESHTQWFSLEASGRILEADAAGELELVETAQFILANPNQARVELYGPDGALERTWIANDQAIYAHDHVSLDTSERPLPDILTGTMSIPDSLEAISEQIQPHPLAVLIPSDLADFIYPARLAQQPGVYEVTGEESLAERPVWALDYTKSLKNGDYLAATYWVDQATGIVLQARLFAPDGRVERQYELEIQGLDQPVYDFTFEPWF